MSWTEASHDELPHAYWAHARGDHALALELTRRHLSKDPEDSAAHALLALVLVALKRLHAAEAEARLALTLDAGSAFAHRALGVVLFAKKDWKTAEGHLVQALELEPDAIESFRALAMLRAKSGRRREARELLDRALSLAPEDGGVLTDLAALSLDDGDDAGAERFVRAALELDAEHAEALAVMGRILLRRGDVAGAKEHAVWSIRSGGVSNDGLHLIANIKARESPLLGLWWRWATWMGEVGTSRGIVLLLAAFAIYRTITILFEGTPNATLIPLVQLFWYAAVAYTWVAPSLYARMVNKEIESVSLRQDF
ncbi:tetratricopeptide repeat protein [Myxococcota bacterium]|nr:tetratricopeptide repeat protein [Myxococcota bacterium]